MVVLPAGYSPGLTFLDPAYFVLPLCDGSDPLPWSINVLSRSSPAQA